MSAKGDAGNLSIDRRELLKASAGGLIAAALPATAWSQTPKSGGTLLLSSGGDPPTLDMHQSATYLTEFVGSPCFSTLLRIDPTDINKLVPDLADKYEV
jgi:peptide/nickel transport system substrate-binding protein